MKTSSGPGGPGNPERPGYNDEGECGVVQAFGGHGGITVGGVDYIAVEDAAKLVREEREACAQVADKLGEEVRLIEPKEIAAAIRARGQPAVGADK